MKRALDAPVFSAAPPGFVAAHEVSHSSPTPPALADIKDELYLTYPPMRLNAGYGEMLQRPSRFLTEVPTELREKWQVAERVGDWTVDLPGDGDREMAPLNLIGVVIDLGEL